MRVNYNKRVTHLIPEGLVSKNGKEMFYAACNNGEWKSPSGVEKISRYVRFSGIRKVVLADECNFYCHTTSDVNNDTFLHNLSIEEIYFGNSIKRLMQDYLFRGCKKLQLISAPALESIGGIHYGKAFDGCDNLKRIIAGPDCCFSSWEKDWPKDLVIEAPKGSRTIDNAKKAGLLYKEI